MVTRSWGGPEESHGKTAAWHYNFDHWSSGSYEYFRVTSFSCLFPPTRNGLNTSEWLQSTPGHCCMHSSMQTALICCTNLLQQQILVNPPSFPVRIARVFTSSGSPKHEDQYADELTNSREQKFHLHFFMSAHVFFQLSIMYHAQKSPCQKKPGEARFRILCRILALKKFTQSQCFRTMCG